MIKSNNIFIQLIDVIYNIAFNIFLSFMENISPNLQSIIWQKIYEFSAKVYDNQNWKFMNFGYTSLDHQNSIILDKNDEDNRYYIQLYNHVLSNIDLKDLKVLEIGSGRGGGADYIKRYFKCKKMVGIDFSENAVKFCTNNYDIDGLSFKIGNAESLPLPDNSFDVVINVESSHCYASIDNFLSEVKRILPQNGYFLFADFRDVKEMNFLREKLDQSGFTLIKETDITPNIIKAIELDNERKTNWIKTTIHKPLISIFIQMSGCKNSDIYNRFTSGKTIYHSFILSN